MDFWQAKFVEILDQRLVPEFCADVGRQCETSGFRRESIRVAEADARDFVRAWTGGLIRHQRRGLYRAPKSAASEQFFWTGRKLPIPRSFTLWLEPIITVAALARLHWNFGWPAELIGTQSSDWAFDIVGFHLGKDSEYLAGEVKKSAAEIDQLISFMRQFGQDPSVPMPTLPRARNAYKKLLALRRRRASIFWAVGPNEISQLYRIEYGSDGTIKLIRENQDALRYDERADLST